MCGRYVITDEGNIDEIEAILQEINNHYKGSSITAKTGEIFPTNNAPILSIQGGKPSLSLMKWGFPKWDKKGVIINARSETAPEKKMFAKSLATQRCVILSTGFYEWAKTDGKTKEKYLFNSNDSPMLYMAGFYKHNIENDQEELINSNFVILTRAANESISSIHDRMPVILYKNELVNWLKDDAFVDIAMHRDNVSLVRRTAQ